MTLTAPPDTSTARLAADLVADASHPALVHHVWRTWYFGRELLATHAAGADLEVAFVASMLHDLGLTDRADGPDAFEREGADAAAVVVARAGWDEDRVELVRAAIASHLDVASAEARPEIALVHLGAAADVVGLRVDQIPSALLEAVLDAHPRGDFTSVVLPLLERQAARTPDSTIAALFRDFDFGRLVVGCPLDHLPRA